MSLTKTKNKFILVLKEQKGVSLLFAILILSVVLSIGLGISLIVIQQAKMMGEMGNSVIAFYAADAGIEEFLLSTSTPVDIPPTALQNGATYQIKVEASSTPNCLPFGASYYCITSTGVYKKTSRAIEIIY